jgi:hypothetical protein
MTEPMIQQTEADVEDFTDELSDEALDREEGTRLWIPLPSLSASINV